MSDQAHAQSANIRTTSWTSIASMPALSVVSAMAWAVDGYPWTTDYWRAAIALPLLILSARSAIRVFGYRKQPVTRQLYQPVLNQWVAGLTGGVGVTLIVSDDLGAVRLCIVFCMLAILVLLRGWIPLDG